MSISVEPVREDDLDQLVRLGTESFAHSLASIPDDFPSAWNEAYRTWVVRAGGVVVAKAIDRSFDSWFWGAKLPTSGVAGVGIRAEERGRSLLAPMMRTLLHDSHERGSVVSGLYPTVPGIYRPYGYGAIAAFEIHVVPLAALADLPAAPGRVERAGPGDEAVVADVYETWAATQNGPLSRTGPAWAGADRFDAPGAGTTVARDDAGAPIGFARWRRVPGDPGLEVEDLIALTADGHRLLARSLGSHRSAVRNADVVVSGWFPTRDVLRQGGWTRRRESEYGLAILDVAGALSRRVAPMPATLVFSVAGLPIDGQSGRYRLHTDGGPVEVERLGPVDESGVCFTAVGFAQRFAGARSNGELRMSGGLTGPTGDDAVWDALFGGWSCRILDYY